MFRAVRNRFMAAWNRERMKHLSGLFTFEFTVVVLGVLTAQAVQGWAQEHDQRQHAEAEQFRLEQNFIGAVQAAKVWRAAIPCLRQRVGDVMRVSSMGGSLRADAVRRPKLLQLGYDGTDAETSARIAKLAGAKQATALNDVQGRVATVQNASLELRSQWELFRLLDADFGQPGTADRAAVRVASAHILAELRTIEFALDMIEAQATIVHGRLAVPFDREFGTLPVRNCAELWAKGTAYRKIEPGETPPY